ncbi:SDR family NAD(P)-dependent oxidoreductase [Actinoplanes sp. CA-252034]|uniref:SDR family NAD(P)-dependent oxidoreductase n=1 Tax=Actinoplanes sp. CA-252034 TaxID=3239906 RepID=UPI003D9810A5
MVLASDHATLSAGLAEVAAGGGLSGVTSSARLGFLFTGQGSQRVDMGRGLYASFPVFASEFDRVALHLDQYLDRPLAEVLADEELIHQTGYAQPAIFAVEVALHALLESWGVRPDVLVGHSIGEIAAAHVAGVFSLADAAVLVTARGRLMQALPAGGAMLAVQASEDEVRAAFPGIDIAAVNGPRSVVVSGPDSDISEIAAGGWKSTRLRTSHAFHSRLMEPMLADFDRVVRRLSFRAPSIPVVSSGDWSDPAYWVSHVRDTVRFADAIAQLGRGPGAGVDAAGPVSEVRFVELGPDAVLSALVDDAVPLLRRDGDEVTTALTAVARLFVSGVAVDWTAFHDGVRPAALPTYAFQRQRYWLEARTERADPVDTAFWDTIDRGDLAQLTAELGVDPATSLQEALPALTSWRARGRERSRLDGLRYRITWQPVTDPGPRPLTGTWLLLGTRSPASGQDHDGAVQGHGDGLESGAAVPGKEGGSAAQRESVPGPEGVGADWHGLVAALTAHGARVVTSAPEGPVAGVICLADGLDDALEVAREAAAPVWFVTRAAVSAGRSDLPADPVQAQVWGLGRTMALEHPDRWGGLLDLPETIDERAAGRIAAVLGGALGSEDQVAVRAGGLLVRRLQHAPAVRVTADWRPSGTVLIAGGTGGLGGAVARWAAENGAERIVLVSRRGGETDIPNAEVHACDLADRDAVEALLTAVGPVDAVVHAAGVSEHATILEADAEHVRRVVDGKVLGALHLDELAGDVDAFVVFSSISGIWGSAEQAAYGAANAALDALIARRRAQGKPGTAIAWGPWARVGMAAGDDTTGRLRRQGLSPIEPNLGLAAMTAAVGSGEEAVTVADVRWADFLPLFTATRERPLFAALAEAGPVEAAGGPPRRSPRGWPG